MVIDGADCLLIVSILVLYLVKTGSGELPLLCSVKCFEYKKFKQI